MENYRWERTPRPNNTVIRWDHLYVTLNPAGKLAFNRYTYERLGEPEAALLLFDRVTQTIGVQPVKASTDDAFPIRGVTGKPGRVIHASRLIKEWNIQLPYGVRFHRANFNPDGILILDLRETRRTQRSREQKDVEARA